MPHKPLLDYTNFKNCVDKYKEIASEFDEVEIIINTALSGITSQKYQNPVLTVLDDMFFTMFNLFYEFDEDYMVYTSREIEELYLSYVHQDGVITFPEFEDLHRKHIQDEQKFLQQLVKEKGLPPFLNSPNVLPLKKRGK